MVLSSQPEWKPRSWQRCVVGAGLPWAEVGSNLTQLQGVRWGQSRKFVSYAPDIKAGMEWADRKHWTDG